MILKLREHISSSLSNDDFKKVTLDGSQAFYGNISLIKRKNLLSLKVVLGKALKFVL